MLDTPVGRLVRRFVVTIVGFAVLALGVVLLPLPGPGFIVVVLGLIILATEFVWAQRLVVKAKKQAISVQEAAVASRLRTAGTLLFGVGMMALGVTMAMGVTVRWPILAGLMNRVWTPTTGWVFIVTGLILVVSTIVTLRLAKGKPTAFAGTSGRRIDDAAT